MTIVEQIKEFVKQECFDENSKYGADVFESHFVPMVSYAKRLATIVDADSEIVEIAAWLHDIGSIMHGRKDHHLTGATIADNKLSELGYPRERIEHIKDCIRHHRGSQSYTLNTIEEKVVADADTVSNYDNIAGLFEKAFIYKHLSREQAQKAIRDKIIRKWNKLQLEESRNMVREHHKAFMLLLQ